MVQVQLLFHLLPFLTLQLLLHFLILPHLNVCVTSTALPPPPYPPSPCCPNYKYSSFLHLLPLPHLTVCVTSIASPPPPSPPSPSFPCYKYSSSSPTLILLPVLQVQLLVHVISLSHLIAYFTSTAPPPPPPFPHHREGFLKNRKKV